IGKGHPEASAPRGLERTRADVRGVRIRRTLELGHRLDDEIFAVRDRREARRRDGETRALHLRAIGLDEGLFGRMVLADRFDRRTPVLMTELERGFVQSRFGLAVELVAPLVKGDRVVMQELLLFQPRVDRIAPDGERALHLWAEGFRQPVRVLVEGVRGRLSWGT